VYQDFTEWLWALQTPLSPDLVDAVRQSPVWVRAQVQPWVIVSPLVDRDRQASTQHGRLPTLRGATLVVRTPLVWLSTKPALPTGPSRHPSPDQDGVGAVGDDGEEEEDEAAVGFACFYATLHIHAPPASHVGPHSLCSLPVTFMPTGAYSLGR
jgi:hypothetical protein